MMLSAQEDATLSVHEQVLQLNQQMETLASEGEWEEVAKAMTKRNGILSRLTGADSGPTLLAAQSTTKAILQLAEKAKQELSVKLTNIHRGKQARENYLACS